MYFVFIRYYSLAYIFFSNDVIEFTRLRYATVLGLPKWEEMFRLFLLCLFLLMCLRLGALSPSAAAVAAGLAAAAGSALRLSVVAAGLALSAARHLAGASRPAASPAAGGACGRLLAPLPADTLVSCDHCLIHTLPYSTAHATTHRDTRLHKHPGFRIYNNYQQTARQEQLSYPFFSLQLSKLTNV